MAARAIAGLYVPAASSGRLRARMDHHRRCPLEIGLPAVVTKRRLREVDRWETVSTVKSPQGGVRSPCSCSRSAEGCGRGCRFCLEGQVYRPVRHRSLGALRESVVQIAKESKRVGLVGARVSDYPWIGELMKMLEEEGVEVSISSLRADSSHRGSRGLARAGRPPHADHGAGGGTERLRRAVRKPITDAQLLAAC